MRYQPARMRMKELVDEGYLGRPQFISVALHVNYGMVPTMEPYYFGWVSEKSKGGGAFSGLGSHYLDLLMSTFGEVAELAGRTRIIVPERPKLTFEYRDGDPIDASTPTNGTGKVDADDAAMFTGRMRSGALVSFTCSWSLHHAQGVRIEAYGDEGTLLLDREDKLWGAKKGDKAISAIEVPARLALPELNAYHHARSFSVLAREVAAAVQGAGGPRRFATFEDGVRVQQVLAAVEESMRGRGWVALPGV
jgi:predicted dehydrogenase